LIISKRIIGYVHLKLWASATNETIIKGIYVLTDAKFHPLAKISHERGREGILQQTQPFLYFPAGIIRGALASMGIKAQVQAECMELPGVTFQIRTVGAKP
jgi:hypothetical protein